jgi:hypothetical protein
LRDVIPRIQEAGADVVILGNGTADQVSQFSQDLAHDLPVYTDPTLRAYRAVGAKRNLWGVLQPRVFIRAIQAWRQGHRQEGVRGDAQQLGGLFLITPDGVMPYADYADYAGDHPKPASVLEAVRTALATSA